MLALLLLLLAQDVDVGLRLREWLARAEGTLAADGRGNDGTSLDVRSDLGLDDRVLVHELQGFVDIPEVGLFSAGYWRLDLEGDEVLDAPATFDGRTFPAGTPVESRLRLDVFSLDYQASLLRGELELDLLAGARYLAAEADLETSGGGAHATLNRPLLLPGLRAGVEFAPGWRAEGRLEGLAFSAHNVRARYAETELAVAAEPLRGLTLSLGYRHLVTYFKAREDSLNFDLDGSIGGVFAAVAWRF